MTSYLEELCRPTGFLDYASPVVRDFVRRVVPDPSAGTDVERARALYYAVRDGIRYEVCPDLSREGMRASSIIKRGTGFCVHKTIVYAAVARAAGVPCRLLYADVRYHLASDWLMGLAGANVFHFHALNSVFVAGHWVNATPVFSKLMCRSYGMRPLDFDGIGDNRYHPHDVHTRRHMEFLDSHGEFDDLPYELVVGGIRSAHPELFEYETPVLTGVGRKVS